jgi:hypothetical protein
MPGHGETVGFNEEQLTSDDIVNKLKLVKYQLCLFYQYICIMYLILAFISFLINLIWLNLCVLLVLLWVVLLWLYLLQHMVLM